MADTYEMTPQTQPETKTSGLSVANFLSTIRAAQPETTKMISDEMLFNDFVKQYPNEPQIAKLSGLSLHQMSTVIRSGQDAGNNNDFETVQNFLEQYPKEHSRLNMKDKVKLGLSNMAEYLPMGGAVVGGAIPLALAPASGGVSLGAESLGVGLGTAAGVMGKDIINRAVGKETPGVMDSTINAVNEGLVAGGLNVIGGSIIPALAKSSKPMAAQLIKAFEGIDEKTAIRVIKDPEMLNRALPMEEAQNIFGKFMNDSGYKYGPESLKAVNGGKRISSGDIEKLTNNTLDKIEAVSGGLEKLPENKNFVKELTQEALAARYSLGDLIKSAQVSGKKSLAKSFLKDKELVDSWLEKQIPGFEKINIIYSEAMAKEAFSPFLATNKNGTVSVLRALAGIVETVHNPISGVPLMAAGSPYLGGKVLQGSAMIKKLPLKPVKNLAAGAIADTISQNEKAK